MKNVPVSVTDVQVHLIVIVIHVPRVHLTIPEHVPLIVPQELIKTTEVVQNV